MNETLDDMLSVAATAGIGEKFVEAAEKAASTEWVDTTLEADADGGDATALDKVTKPLRSLGLTVEQARDAWAARLLAENRDEAPTNSRWSLAQGVSSIAKSATLEAASTLREAAGLLIA